MKRSAGVTAAAVVMLICSSLFLILAGIAVSSVFMGPPIHRVTPRQELPAILVGMSVYFVCGILGIMSARGLLKLREWARVVTLVFSGAAIAFSIFMIAVWLFVPIPAGPNVAPEFLHGLRMILAGIFALPLGIALWWIIYFNRASTRAQFLTEPASPLEPNPRPISITIIGWYMVVSAVISLPFIARYGIAVIFVWLVRPPMAFAWIIFLATWCMSAGIGLLKLRRWGFLAAITYQVWGIVQGICIALRPDIFQKAMELTLEAKRRSIAALPASFPRLIAAFAIISLGIILWFLVTRRDAFAHTLGGPNALSAENGTV
jgi:hypothetical protein